MTARTPTLVAAGLAVVGILGGELLLHRPFTPIFGLLLVIAVLGELVTLPRSRGRAVSLSLAAIGVGALEGAGPSELAVLAAAAWVVQSVLNWREGHRPRFVELSVRVAGAVALGVAMLVTDLALGLPVDGVGPPAWPDVLVVWVAVLGIVPALDHLELQLLASRAGMTRLEDAVRSGFPAGLVVATLATLGSLVHEQLGYVTIPLMALPLLAAKRGLDGYETMRQATSQTIRAMSRLPEQIDAVETGHGVRAGQRARAIGATLGLSAEATELTERAALLHAVGRIRAKDHPALTEEDAAHASVDIIRQAGGLDQVAAIVMASYEVALLPDLAAQDDPDALLLSAAIVQASCRWDGCEAYELVGDRRLPLAVRDVIMQLDATGTHRGLEVAAPRR